MTEEEETHNRDKVLVSLTKLNTPFYTLVRYGNDKQTKKRKEVENMKQHSDWLYPVAYFGKFLEYKASEVTYDELKNLAGVVTFIMAFLPQPSNLNHRFVNRRFDKDNESFISYLIGMVRRLSSSLKRSQKDKRSSVDMFTLTEHELFGCIRRGKTQIVQYAPLFLLKYKPKKDSEEEALNELRNKEHDHHTNFTMPNIELWEKRDSTIQTHTVMCMGHRLAKLLEDVVRHYDTADVETFIQHDVQIELRNRIESEIGKYLKEEVCKEGSDINEIVMFDIIDNFSNKFAWCFQKRCVELYNLYLVDMDDFCINGCGQDMANKRGAVTWNELWSDQSKKRKELEKILATIIEKKNDRERKGIFEEKLCEQCYEKIRGQLSDRVAFKEGVSCIHVKKTEDNRKDSI